MAQNNYSHDKKDSLSQSPSVKVGGDLKLGFPTMPSSRSRGDNVLTPGDNLNTASSLATGGSLAGDVLSDGAKELTDNVNVLKALEYTTKFIQIQQDIKTKHHWPMLAGPLWMMR